MKTYFLKLFGYNRWANARVISAVNESNIREGDIIKLISHILNVEYVWLGRITGNEEYDKEIWGIYRSEAIEQEAQDLAGLWVKFLEGMEESKIQEQISYRNSKGEDFTNTVEDILPQVINHGTYHRAQINKILRQNNITPPNIDYINFIRYKQ